VASTVVKVRIKINKTIKIKITFALYQKAVQIGFSAFKQNESFLKETLLNPIFSI
jgi:hypothetical protein